MPYKSAGVHFMISNINHNYGAISLFGNIIVVYERSNQDSTPNPYGKYSLVMFQVKEHSSYLEYIFRVLGILTISKKVNGVKVHTYQFHPNLLESDLPVEIFQGQNLDFFIHPHTYKREELWQLFPEYYKGELNENKQEF